MFARAMILLLVPAVVAGCRAEPAAAPPPRIVAPAPVCKAGHDAPQRLRLGVSRTSSSTFFDDGFRPVADLVASRLGLPVDLVLTDRYDELADLLASGDADLAVLPPLTYVHARERMPCLSLLLTMVSRGDVY
jgi:ABC-type phosphate/phosphonate transport system substrate-binding protein